MPALGLGEDFRLFVATGGHKTPLPESLRVEEMGIELERSIVSGSTLTMKMRDPERILQQAGYFTRAVGNHKANRSDVLFQNLWFRACHFGKNADEYTLTFEDREVSMARDYKTPFKMSAGGHPNPTAAFLKAVFHKAVPHCVFYCPEFDKQIRILPHEETEKQKERKKKPGAVKTLETKDGQIVAQSRTTAGVTTTTTHPTVSGEPLDAEQKRMVEILVGVCDAKKAPPLAKLAIICAALGESTLHNLKTPNGSGYWGILQGGSGQNGSEGNFPHTPSDQTAKEMAESFLDGGRGFQAGGAINLVHSGKTDPGDIATKVEASGEPPEFYGKFKGDAEGIISSIGGSGLETTSGGAESSYTPQRFLTLPVNERSEGEEAEGAWEAGEQYSEKIRWRLFCTGGQFNFMSDIYLEKAKPKMVIDDSTNGITDIKWEIDVRERKNPPQLQVEARAPHWNAGPGSVIIIGEKNGKELHEGVWLVSTIARPDITDAACTITLERPRAPLAEHQLAAIARKAQTSVFEKGENPSPGGHPTNEGHNAGTAGPSDKVVKDVLFNAEWIAGRNIPYVWGGGHKTVPGPSLGAEGDSAAIAKGLNPPLERGVDCSGAVRWLLASSHILPFPERGWFTWELINWGDPGPGKNFTVWVINTTAHEHVYVEFHLPGMEQCWEARESGTITGFVPHFNAPAGYHARHWPGS